MTLLLLSSCSAAAPGFQIGWPASQEGAGLSGPRSRAGLGVEPVNSAKLWPGSTPSLPGAQRDDITQTEPPAWMGFNSRDASTCRAPGLTGFTLHLFSAPYLELMQL